MNAAERLETGTMFIGNSNGRTDLYLRAGGGIVCLTGKNTHVTKRRRNGEYPDISVVRVVGGFGQDTPWVPVPKREPTEGEVIHNTNRTVTVTMSREAATLLQAVTCRVHNAGDALRHIDTVGVNLERAGISTSFGNRKKAFRDGNVDYKALVGA